MRFSIIPLLLTAVVFIACENKPASTESTAATDSTKTDSLPLPRVWELKMQTGKVVIVNETHPKGASLSDVKVYFKEDSTGALTFTDVDPISSAITGDLDKNGFDELYLITTSAGSGSYGNILGISSNRDKSISYVFVPEMDPNDKLPGKLFDGYEGHDQYAFENGTLIRSFPFKGDKNNMKSVPYQVVMGEGGLILSPKRN